MQKMLTAILITMLSVTIMANDKLVKLIPSTAKSVIFIDVKQLLDLPMLKNLRKEQKDVEEGFQKMEKKLAEYL